MKQTHQLLSNDKHTKLNVIEWSSGDKPTAILQIVHGMAEYIERYEEFAEFLNKNNITVIGHDHLGHGKSVDPKKPVYGYFKKDNSQSILVSDVSLVTS